MIKTFCSLQFQRYTPINIETKQFCHRAFGGIEQTLIQVNKGGKFLKKPWCCVGERV